jgi:hypothetical protein
MKKILIAGSLAALTLAGAGIATAQPGRVPNATISRADAVAKADARFDRLDANHDGKLSADDRAAGLAARFKALDSDGNGQLSFAEFQAAAQKRGDGMQGGRGGHRGGRGLGHGGGHGGGFGGDPSGSVTKADFQAKALAHFDRADADHDGQLTPAERQQARRAFKARPGA